MIPIEFHRIVLGPLKKVLGSHTWEPLSNYAGNNMGPLVTIEALNQKALQPDIYKVMLLQHFLLPGFLLLLLKFTMSPARKTTRNPSVGCTYLYPVGCRDLYVVIKINTLERVSLLLHVIY